MTIEPRNTASESVSIESEKREFLGNEEFLLGIFTHPKCLHFQSEDKRRIREAFALACEAHENQKRKDGEPYMLHIRGAVWDYLKTSRFEKLSDDDIIIMILHDVIEDKPEYTGKIIELFGPNIFSEVEQISKMPKDRLSPDSLISQFGRIFWSIYNRAQKEGIAEYLPYITGTMYGIGEFFYQQMSHVNLRTHVILLYPQMQDDPRNYFFLAEIINLSERKFERKCADRINNLRYLKHVDLDYIEKNLISTDVYIMKAEALGRRDLANKLNEGKNGLLARRREIKGIGL